MFLYISPSLKCFHMSCWNSLKARSWLKVLSKSSQGVWRQKLFLEVEDLFQSNSLKKSSGNQPFARNLSEKITSLLSWDLGLLWQFRRNFDETSTRSFVEVCSKFGRCLIWGILKHCKYHMFVTCGFSKTKNSIKLQLNFDQTATRSLVETS